MNLNWVTIGNIASGRNDTGSALSTAFPAIKDSQRSTRLGTHNRTFDDFTTHATFDNVTITAQGNSTHERPQSLPITNFSTICNRLTNSQKINTRQSTRQSKLTCNELAQDYLSTIPGDVLAVADMLINPSIDNPSFAAVPIHSEVTQLLSMGLQNKAPTIIELDQSKAKAILQTLYKTYTISQTYTQDENIDKTHLLNKPLCTVKNTTAQQGKETPKDRTLILSESIIPFKKPVAADKSAPFNIQEMHFSNGVFPHNNCSSIKTAPAPEGRSLISKEAPRRNIKLQTDNFPSTPKTQKSITIETESLINQAEDSHTFASTHSCNKDFSQISSLHSPQTFTITQSPTLLQSIEANDSNYGHNTPDIGEQSQQSLPLLLYQNNQRIIVCLNPPELGRILIKLYEQEGQVTGLLEVNKLQTKYEIKQMLPQILQNLQDYGVQTKKFEIMLMDQPQQHAYRHHHLPNNGSEQYSDSEDNYHYSSPNTEGLIILNECYDVTTPQKVFITDNSLNMLI